MITQFKGESRRRSIVNHFSLDSVEEDSFFKYVDDMGYAIDDEDSVIEGLHEIWNANLNID